MSTAPSRKPTPFSVTVFLLVMLFMASMFFRNLKFNASDPLVQLNNDLTDSTWSALGIAHHGWAMLTGPTTSTFSASVRYFYTDGTSEDWNVFPIRQGYLRSVWNETAEDLFLGVNGGVYDPNQNLLTGFFNYQCAHKKSADGNLLVRMEVHKAFFPFSTFLANGGNLTDSEKELPLVNSYTCTF